MRKARSLGIRDSSLEQSWKIDTGYLQLCTICLLECQTIEDPILFQGLPGSLGFVFSLCQFRDTLLPENFADFGQSRSCEMGQSPSESMHLLKLSWSFSKSISAAGGHGPIYLLTTAPKANAGTSPWRLLSSCACSSKQPHIRLLGVFHCTSSEASTHLLGGFSHPWMLGLHGKNKLSKKTGGTTNGARGGLRSANTSAPNLLYARLYACVCMLHYCLGPAPALLRQLFPTRPPKPKHMTLQMRYHMQRVQAT